MARFTFAQDDDPASPSLAAQITTVIVRFVGVLLLVVGLGVSLRVIGEAWSLYTEPQRIERLAQAIERGSNLDQALVSARPQAEPPRQLVPDLAGAPAVRPPPEPDEPPPDFRLSYFAAWVIALLLLMLVGRLSLAAVRTGGELALYDLKLKEVARSLVREARQAKK